MRKLFIFLLLSFLVAGCVGNVKQPPVVSSDRLMDMLAGSEVNKVRAFTTHTGGGSGALDKIATANLSNGDMSFVITGGREYVYVFDSTGTDAEDTTDYKFIRPDDFGAAGVWDLLSRTALGYTTSPAADPQWEFQDSESPGADKSTAWIKAIYVDGADGSENGDIFIEVIKGGAENTEVLRYDESDDRWETTQGLLLEGAISLGTGGVVITDDGDGLITFLGAGDGFDENFYINLDDTSNTAGFGSTTGLTSFDFGSINLITTGAVAGAIINRTTNGNPGSGNRVLTAAMLIGGLIDEDPEGAANWTLDTAANIVSAIAVPVVGATFKVILMNDATAASGEVVTILQGSGVTLHGSTVTLTEGTNETAVLFFRLTNIGGGTEAVDCYIMTGI
jgi:hypothetical protein